MATRDAVALPGDAFTANVARAAAAAVFRVTSAIGRPRACTAGRPRAGRRARESHAGCSRTASVVVPAPPCAPTTTTSPAAPSGPGGPARLGPR